LLVRDHFSRRLGAFMGVKVDAEEPGLHPETVELYP
jgi:dimethylamine monooxygenase subunit C